MITTTITKKSVTRVMEGMYSVTYNLLYKDETVTLLDEDFSETFKVGQAWANLTLNMRTRMKAAIRYYKEEQAVISGAPIDASVANLNSTVGV